jgi:hypothetical protein
MGKNMNVNEKRREEGGESRGSRVNKKDGRKEEERIGGGESGGHEEGE